LYSFRWVWNRVDRLNNIWNRWRESWYIGTIRWSSYSVVCGFITYILDCGTDVVDLDLVGECFLYLSDLTLFLLSFLSFSFFCSFFSISQFRWYYCMCVIWYIFNCYE
jgi:hypothetical protein